jgi:hypothetical protein
MMKKRNDDATQRPTLTRKNTIITSYDIYAARGRQGSSVFIIMGTKRGLGENRPSIISGIRIASNKVYPAESNEAKHV